MHEGIVRLLLDNPCLKGFTYNVKLIDSNVVMRDVNISSPIEINDNENLDIYVELELDYYVQNSYEKTNFFEIGNRFSIGKIIFTLLSYDMNFDGKKQQSHYQIYMSSSICKVRDIGVLIEERGKIINEPKIMAQYNISYFDRNGQENPVKYLEL